MFSVNDMRCADIFHYGTSRCPRVSWSVMAAEVHAWVHAAKSEVFIQETLRWIGNEPVGLDACVDSRTFFKDVVNISNSTKRRLLITILVFEKGVWTETWEEVGGSPARKTQQTF